MPVCGLLYCRHCVKVACLVLVLIRKKTDFYSAPSILYVWFECIHSYTAPCCEHVCAMQYMCSASPELHCKYIYTLLWQKDVSKFNFQYFFIPHAVVLFLSPCTCWYFHSGDRMISVWLILTWRDPHSVTQSLSHTHTYYSRVNQAPLSEDLQYARCRSPCK